MKLGRRDLRRLIESVINEEENPGSAFGSEEMNRMGVTRADISAKEDFKAAEEDANKTLEQQLSLADRLRNKNKKQGDETDKVTKKNEKQKIIAIVTYFPKLLIFQMDIEKI